MVIRLTIEDSGSATSSYQGRGAGRVVPDEAGWFDLPSLEPAYGLAREIEHNPTTKSAPLKLAASEPDLGAQGDSWWRLDRCGDT